MHVSEYQSRDSAVLNLNPPRVTFFTYGSLCCSELCHQKLRDRPKQLTRRHYDDVVCMCVVVLLTGLFGILPYVRKLIGERFLS
jgi:hypothetical protein